ncbi:hypothetical protein N7G274_005891 [Stereocaulon virgatum]|uniref:Uncharacterized protein n=1 Tax=Stereocaulon virgatum TaxID=373712 RepID=A0ABR4A9U7_9LECA
MNQIHRQYSPIPLIHESTRHDSNRTSRDSSDGIELENVQVSGETAVPLTSAPITTSHGPHEQVFNSKKQTRRLFFAQFFRWLGTVGFVALILVTLKIFESNKNFSHISKYLLNTICTALILGLGLNFFEAFKDIAKVLRWRILAYRRNSVREVDLILGIESLSKVVQLAWVSRRKFLTVLTCISWLLMNLIAQAAVAIISLTFTADSGTDWKGTYLRNGNVNATNLTCFFGANGCPIQPEVEQIRAHTHGEIASGHLCHKYDNISEVLSSDVNPPYWCKETENQQEYTFRFLEYNPHDQRRVYPSITNRTITASSGQCYHYNIIAGSQQPALDLNGDRAAFTWAYSNGTVNGSVNIPTEMSAFDATTYIYNGTNIPRNEIESSCGPRCMWMWAFKALSNIPMDHGQRMALYQCPITVSPVSGNGKKVHDKHKVSNDMAKLAASAIGLQGRYANPPQMDYKRVWRQYQLYPWGSTWDIHGRRTDEVGANMAKFALASLVRMADVNPTFETEGIVPILGYRLSIHWKYAIALFACIVGVHFILFAAAIYTSRLVIIIDDSNLSIARLLRPLVEYPGPRAALLKGKEFSQAIEEHVPLGVMYGPREDRGLGGTVWDFE